MGKKTKMALIIFCIVFLSLGFYVYTRYLQTQKIELAAAEFLKSVATGDTGKINAVGEALWKIKTSDKLPKSDVLDIKFHTSNFSRKWARTKAVLELRLSDNSVTVNWYELDLIKDKRNWKVIAVREAMPIASGIGGVDDIDELTGIFKEYCSALGEQNQNKSLFFLAGPARTAQERSSSRFPTGKFEQIKITPLYGTKTFAVTKASYLIDRRPVSSLISFYKTTQGWKIVAVQAL